MSNFSNDSCQGQESADESINKLVNEGKWAVMGIFESDDFPTFSYTVGMHHHGLPELMIVGIQADLAQVILNNAAKMMFESDKAFEEGKPIYELANFPTIPVYISQENINELTCSAIRHYHHSNYSVFQMVIPDSNGLFPWQSNFDEKMSLTLQVLGDVPQEIKGISYLAPKAKDNT